MKPLIQLVHSLKTRMESPDYEMVGDKKSRKQTDVKSIALTGRESHTSFQTCFLIQDFVQFWYFSLGFMSYFIDQLCLTKLLKF